MRYFKYIAVGSLVFLSGCFAENSLKLSDDLIPQGLKSYKGEYYMSAHQHDLASYLYKVNLDTGDIKLLFKMPKEATHTSGVCFDGNDLIAVDYNSDMIYFVDIAKSVRDGQANVKRIISSQLKGTSACDIVDDSYGKYLIVSDFRNTGKTYLYDYKKLVESGSASGDAIAASYKNDGFSQGVLYDNGFIYESGNSLLGFCKISKRSIKDILNNRKIQIKSKYILSLGVQDITVKDDNLYYTDEVDAGIHKTTKINSDALY